MLPAESTTAVLFPSGVRTTQSGRAVSRRDGGSGSLLTTGGLGGEGAATDGRLVGHTSPAPSLIWYQLSFVIGLYAMAVVVPRMPRVLVGVRNCTAPSGAPREL